MLLFLDLCLELKDLNVGRKRRNQAKNKVKQNAVYCYGVDNDFLDVSAALSLPSVWTGTVCFQIQEVNICILCYLPNISLHVLTVFALASHRNSERNRLRFPLHAEKFALQMLRGRSSSFIPLHPSVWPHGAHSCHGPVPVGDAERHTGFLVVAMARNTMYHVNTCTVCTCSCSAQNNTWAKSTLCLHLFTCLCN